MKRIFKYHGKHYKTKTLDEDEEGSANVEERGTPLPTFTAPAKDGERLQSVRANRTFDRSFQSIFSNDDTDNN